MVVDPRHDHSMRIPRPDRTIALGTPNACGNCHAKQGAKWAADAVARWYPERKPGQQTFAEALAAGDRGAPGAQARARVARDDAALPPIARASAIARLVRHPGRATLPALRRRWRRRLAGASCRRDRDSRRRTVARVRGCCRDCSPIRCGWCASRLRAASWACRSRASPRRTARVSRRRWTSTWRRCSSTPTVPRRRPSSAASTPPAPRKHRRSRRTGARSRSTPRTLPRR